MATRGRPQAPTCIVPLTSIMTAAQMQDEHWTYATLGATMHDSKVTLECKSRLQLHQLMTYIYGWSLGDPLQRIVREAGISAVSAHTGVDWGQFCRDICEEWVRLNPPQLGGTDPDGNPIIVEIDESKYFRRKYQRGTWREGFIRRSNISGDPFTSFLVAVRGSYPV